MSHLDVITFQIETFKKLVFGKGLAIPVPDLSVFCGLVVTEAIIVAQVGIPLALAGIEEAKKRGWFPR